MWDVDSLHHRLQLVTRHRLRFPPLVSIHICDAPVAVAQIQVVEGFLDHLTRARILQNLPATGHTGRKYVSFCVHVFIEELPCVLYCMLSNEYDFSQNR